MYMYMLTILFLVCVFSIHCALQTSLRTDRVPNSYIGTCTMYVHVYVYG